jgi:hypothetical protein
LQDVQSQCLDIDNGSYLMSSPFRLSELVVGAKKPNLDFTLGRM